MNVGIFKTKDGFALKRSQTLLLSIVLVFSLAGCASKATQDASRRASTSSFSKADEIDVLERAIAEQEALNGYASVAEAAAADPNNGIRGTLSKGFSGTWSNEDELSLAGRVGEGDGTTGGHFGSYGKDDALVGNDWERALLSELDTDSFSPEQLAERVVAARRHALNIAREAEDPTLYSALTGGRDLYEDMATERALAASEFGQGAVGDDYALNPERDYQRRGFFDEESDAFAPQMSEAERIAARVEGARRHAGLTDSDQEMVPAFAHGPYSRIYDRDGDVSGLIALDSGGKLAGWAAPGEVTADGTVFAQGASERMLAQSRLNAGDSSAGQDLFANSAKQGGRRGSGRDRNGATDVAASRANVNEEVIPQTSGGKPAGWAAPGEVTADGSVFAQGASERMLAQSRLDASDSSAAQDLFANSTKRGGKKGSGRDRNGAIDVAASKANVNEEVIPQTLGGALPMVLGVDENGHFDFDAYVLRDEVRWKLDELAAQLQDAEYDRLDVVGYTDRIGGAAYNKDLSHKRAVAVAQYLRDRGVPEYKIKVTGRGQDNPLTQFGDCEGMHGQDKIGCLQPDRRVEIEASIRRMSVEIE